MSGYKAFDIASYIVNSCIDRGTPISNLKLQKVLYYVQAAFLIKNESLFIDQISAWRYGPVVEDVYYYFRINANRPIDEKVPNAYFSEIDDESKKIIDNVVAAKIKYGAFALVNATHEEMPWQAAMKNGKSYIREKDMKEYFVANPDRIYQ